MLRGQLTNQPAPMVLVDWRVLVEVQGADSPFYAKLPKRLRRALSVRRRQHLVVREGARGWIERNWKVRMAVALIGGNGFRKDAEQLLEPFVSEFIWFWSRDEVRMWLHRNPQVLCFYTEDRSLLGLEDTTRKFSGWHEVVTE